MPWLEEQPIYHYNNRSHFHSRFDVTKPVSLLYKKNELGQLKLVGAMYAASELTAPEELDALLPISLAHWHEHVNTCYPRRLGSGGGSPQINGGAVFLLDLFFSITKASECESAGGQFVLVEGWLGHVYLYAGSDDPKVIWGTDDAGNMDMHMRPKD